MTRSLRWGWVLLPYLAVFAGMTLLENAWVALIGFHLSLLPLLLAQAGQVRRFFIPVSFRLLLPVSLAGLAGGLGLWLVWPLAGLPLDFPAQVERLGLRCADWPLFLACFALLNPFLEEWYWRGALGSDSPRPQPVDFLYAGYHISILARFAAPGWVLIGFLLLAGAGWFWRQTARLTGSLLPAALSHLLADASLLIVLYWKAC